MDRKSAIILFVTFALFLTWGSVMDKIFPPRPIPANQLTNNATAGTNAVIRAAGTNGVAVGTNAVAAAATVSTNVPAPSAQEELITLETDTARYIFTSHGGGLKTIELKKYLANVGCNESDVSTNALATLNTRAPAPMFSIAGSAALLGDNVFHITETNGVVRATKALVGGVVLVKEFRLSTNYLIKASLRWENPTGQPLVLPAREVIFGTTGAMGVQDESLALGVEWYDGRKVERTKAGWFENRTLGCFPGTPRNEYTGGESNVVWAAAPNQFFTIIATPTGAAPRVVGRRFPVTPASEATTPSEKRTLANPWMFQGSFAYPEITIPASAALPQDFDIFAGPKEYNVLAKLGGDVDRVMNFDGFFGWFAKILLLAMNGLNSLGVSYAWAIILITVVIKLLFWPMTAASTRSMKRMGALQPQMKAIQDKYKSDPAKMNQKLQEFMRENKVNPLGSCLPLLLQIPVFFGFYTMLQSAIELRGASFLWICDLSQQDTVARVPLPGNDFPINPMAILMGVTMLVQARMTPPSPGMDPAQQKIMKYMPLLVLGLLYWFSSGLTLYWTVQNLLSIVQMKLTKDKPADPKAPSVAAPAPRKA